MAKLSFDIHYWSSTGNTRLAVELAAESLSETGSEVVVVDVGVELQRFNDRQKGSDKATHSDEVFVEKSDLFILATPVHDFRMALIAEEYLRTLKFDENQKVAAIFTFAGFGDRTPLQFSKIAKQAGAIPWDYQNLICEDGWPVARNYIPPICSWDEPSEDRKEYFKAWWRAVPGRLQDNDKGRSFWSIPTPFTPLSFLFHKKLIKHTFPLYIDLEKCTKCRACEKQCPTGRIDVENFPETEGECVACYGCINVCNENAIDTWLTKGAPRYKGPQVKCQK